MLLKRNHENLMEALAELEIELKQAKADIWAEAGLPGAASGFPEVAEGQRGIAADEDTIDLTPQKYPARRGGQCFVKNTRPFALERTDLTATPGWWEFKGERVALISLVRGEVYEPNDYRGTTWMRWNNGDGTYATGWKLITDKCALRGYWYFFNRDGYLMCNTTTPDGHRVNYCGYWCLARRSLTGNKFPYPVAQVELKPTHPMERNEALMDISILEKAGSYFKELGLPYELKYSFGSPASLEFEMSKAEKLGRLALFKCKQCYAKDNHFDSLYYDREADLWCARWVSSVPLAGDASNIYFRSWPEIEAFAEYIAGQNRLHYIME